MNARAISHLNNRIARFDLKSDRVSTGRVALFFAFVGALALENWYLIIGVALAFAGLVAVHRRIDGHKAMLERRKRLAERQAAGHRLDWAKLPPAKEAPPGDRPPYLEELDIMGEHSLLRLLDWTFSTHGFARLVALFCSNGVSDEEIARRAALTGELRRLGVLRTRFLLLTESTHQSDSGQLADLTRGSFLMPGARTRWWVTLVAQALLIATFFWHLFQGGHPLYYSAAALLFLANLWARKRILAGEAYGRALLLLVSLDRFRIATRVLERASRTRLPEVGRILTPFAGEHSATRLLGRLDWIAGALGVRQNYLVHIPLHFVLPWDLLWTFRLEKMRLRLQEDLPAWQAAVAEFEAFASLAQFAEGNPRYRAAELVPAPAKLRCTGLKHPLLDRDRAVGNDLELTEQERCALITGSNMSGKSTFLRTVGINLLLAKAGAPVAADSFSFANLALHTSLGVRDSLDQGLSSFHAEVRRLRDILNDARDGRGAFYLIDEIFRGTNNRERLQGSRAYLSALVKTSSVGLVTTHDLELAALEATHSSIVNYHFRESIEGGTMAFSYRKAKGPCPSTNALEIMRLNGLPVEA